MLASRRAAVKDASTVAQLLDLVHEATATLTLSRQLPQPTAMF